MPDVSAEHDTGFGPPVIDDQTSEKLQVVEFGRAVEWVRVLCPLPHGVCDAGKMLIGYAEVGAKDKAQWFPDVMVWYR